jgi:hypothetical protein
MSSPSDIASTPSTFETLFNAALEKYTEQTGQNIRDYPLASKIDSCKSPDSILEIFQEQARAFDEFRNGNSQLFKWLKPVVKVLHALSTDGVLKEGVCHVGPTMFLPFPIIRSVYLNTIPQVLPHAKVVFSFIGILLSVSISLVGPAPLLIIFGTPRRPKI